MNAMATVEYLGDLRTQAKHLKSGNLMITDAPIDNMGKGEAFSPTDLVSAALSSCMMTIMGQVADREGLCVLSLTPVLHRQLAIVMRQDKILSKGISGLIRLLQQEK